MLDENKKDCFDCTHKYVCHIRVMQYKTINTFLKEFRLAGLFDEQINSLLINFAEYCQDFIKILPIDVLKKFISEYENKEIKNE